MAHLENAENNAFSGGQACQLQESGLGSSSLQDIRNLDSKTTGSANSLPSLELDDKVWAPQESLSLTPVNRTDRSINDPESNRKAIQGTEQDVWAPEESLTLTSNVKTEKPVDGPINDPESNRNAIQGTERNVWAPEESLTLNNNVRTEKPNDGPINDPESNRKAIQGTEQDVWAPEESLSLGPQRAPKSK